MTKKEHTTITELFQVLDLLESLDMQFWLDEMCIRDRDRVGGVQHPSEGRLYRF